MITVTHILDTLGVLAACLAGGYSALALLAAAFGPRRAVDYTDTELPVTIIKPLCGAEGQLETCLRSFCEQDYPAFQIVFGVQDANDPALAVAKRLRRAYPKLAIDIVVDSLEWGANHKISNVINCMRVARHDQLVIADSDIRVERDYLRRVCAPLADDRVGLVTCLYRGWAGPGVWSRLGALFIDDWFAPSVLISHRLGNDEFASGATLALRRETLDAIGGFEAIADDMADDHALGAAVRARGQSIVLSDCIVETYVQNSSLAELISHEKRWMGTIRSLQPICYDLLFITFTLPLIALSLALDCHQQIVIGLVMMTVTTRAGLHAVQNRRSGRQLWRGLWRVPLRDLLTICSWVLGRTADRVRWRGRSYRVTTNSSLRGSARRE